MTAESSLDRVRRTSQTLREMQAEIDALREEHVDALRDALKEHRRLEVAQAAGCSYQSVYKALAKRDGRRNKPRTLKPVPIDF